MIIMRKIMHAKAANNELELLFEIAKIRRWFFVSIFFF